MLPPSTPQTTKALADMLRDSVGRVRCPFGADFEEDAARTTGAPQYRFHRSTLPWWLALLELHCAGYRPVCPRIIIIIILRATSIMITIVSLR